MFKVMKQAYESMTQSYPEQYKERIQKLNVLGKEGIQMVINDILTKPQRIVDQSEKMLLSDAIQQAQREERNFIQIEAPFLTFPRATPEQWNGNIDSIDTITGTYTIFTGDEFEKHNLRLKKTYKGGPQIVPALKKALGYNITMRVDPNCSPSSRFIIVFPSA